MKCLLNWNPSGHVLLKYSYQHRKPSQEWQHAPFLTLEGRQAVPRSFLDWAQSNRLQPRKPALAKMEITLRPAIRSSPRRRPTLCGLQARSPPCRYSSCGSRSEGPSFSLHLRLSTVGHPRCTAATTAPIGVCTGFLCSSRNIWWHSPCCAQGDRVSAFRITRRGQGTFSFAVSLIRRRSE